MMTYVAFDPVTGLIIQLSTNATARKDADIAEVLDAPEGGVDPMVHKVDVASVDMGTCRVVEMPIVERPSLELPIEALKTKLRAEVDAVAERERLKYITAGAGQALVYEAKRTEVSHWRNAGQQAEPDAALYPWAADRAVRRGVPVHDVLAEWAAQADAWAVIGIAIENVRESAKEAIAKATDPAAAREAAAVTWPTVQEVQK